MKDMELKNKVLSEIMSLMDEREGEDLKKHPKLMAAKAEKPESEVLEAPESEESEDEVSPEMLQKLLDHFQGK